jgi:UDP-N-acetylmuramoyl-tripeptide--D-alanyl-D-alanine ligase
MYELGDFSNNEHQNMIDFIEDKDFMKVYLVGDIFYNCKTKSKYFEKFKSAEEMSKSVIFQDFNSTNILIKGSRGLGLENLITS